MAQQTCIHVNCFLAGDNTMCHSILKMHIVGKKPSETPSASRCLSYLIGSSLTDIAWRRQWHPTPVLLPRKPHGWRSLEGCSPWGPKESDTTERRHFQFSLSCIGEGNGNPLQCSCLENPGDGGAWWAAVYGVAHSRTRLKRLSTSSSSSNRHSYSPWGRKESDTTERLHFHLTDIANGHSFCPLLMSMSEAFPISIIL